jgi:hypothetical protein
MLYWYNKKELNTRAQLGKNKADSLGPSVVFQQAEDEVV